VIRDVVPIAGATRVRKSDGVAGEATFCGHCGAAVNHGAVFCTSRGRVMAAHDATGVTTLPGGAPR